MGIELSIVIPAYNEARRVPSTLRSAIDFLSRDGRPAEIILVDDGSTDNTCSAAMALARRYESLRLIRLPENRGKGYAVRTGVVNASGRRVLFADADGATPWHELYRLEAALDSGAKVAIGSRALRAPGVIVEKRTSRFMIGRVFHAMVKRLTVAKYADTQCGFKLFTADAARDLFSRMRMNGFSFDVELLVMAERRGHAVAEVPVNWAHQPGSKVNVVADGMHMAADLFRIRANAVRGVYERPHIATRWTLDTTRFAEEAMV